LKKNKGIFLLFYLYSLLLNAQEIQRTGADKDQQGCIGSAGYQWSQLKKECIRPFELNIQLQNPEKTFSCGILLSKNQQQAEVFCKEGHFTLMKEKRKTIYRSPQQAWILIKDQGKWKIKNAKGKVIYLS
jgi:hypothetical protein